MVKHFLYPTEYKTLMINRIMCRYCGDIIVSREVGHKKKCTCEKTFVDGGNVARLRGGEEGVDYDELSVWSSRKDDNKIQINKEEAKRHMQLNPDRGG